MARSHTGYTTNLPLADVTNGQAWVVWAVDGAPLANQHGGPARLLVPHLYFWKSAKWVSGLQLMDHDEPGFWERNGYHDAVIHGSSSGTKVTEWMRRRHACPAQVTFASCTTVKARPGNGAGRDEPEHRRAGDRADRR